MRSSAHCSFRPTTISASLHVSPTSSLSCAPAQAPAAASGTPGFCQSAWLSGNLSICWQRCLRSLAGRLVSVIKTTTPRAKASVSSVATPLCMLPHDARARVS